MAWRRSKLQKYVRRRRQSKFALSSFFSNEINLNPLFSAVNIDRTMEATLQLQSLYKEQRLKDFKRNALVLTDLKNGKRKKKTLGKYYGRFFFPELAFPWIRCNKNDGNNAKMHLCQANRAALCCEIPCNPTDINIGNAHNLNARRLHRRHFSDIYMLCSGVFFPSCNIKPIKCLFVTIKAYNPFFIDNSK